MDAMGRYFFIFVSVFSIVVELDTVTANPSLCPSNKILSPRRRRETSELNRPRSMGLIHDLLGPGPIWPTRPPGRTPRPQLVNDLQKQLHVEQDNCGEVGDYDEELRSGRIKPIYEDNLDRPQAPFRFGLVGGTLGHIVGIPTVRLPTEDGLEKKKEREKKLLRKPNSPIRFPEN